MPWQTFLRPASLDELLDLLDQHAGHTRLVAGGTDVLVELSRGILPTATLIDVTAVRDLKYVREDGDALALGALATHNDVIASPACVARVLPLAQACWEVGAPQIRTRATVAGNLVTASPANDTITPLVALDATLVLTGKAGGERIVPLRDFYHGVRKTALRPGELLREVRVPALRPNQRGLFLKLGLRRAQAISVINVAFVVTLDGETVVDASIALGCVAPTIVRAPSAEAYLAGRRLDAEACAEAGRLATQDVTPIDDVRGSARYRLAALSGLVAEGLRRLASGRERDGFPAAPILLEALPLTPFRPQQPESRFSGIIATTINGRPYELPPGAESKSLLDALRKDARLTGPKEGCAEGECGACTVWLGGQAVMSCLVPAAQAHGAQVTTIEGLASASPSPRMEKGSPTEGLGSGGENLHPLQRAFIEHGAVQCGFCIPGMLMAGAKLLDERPHPSLDEIQTALSGNLCRCTGYRKIIDAVLAAGGDA
ncbi:MAG TPA: FAD binding domain-containing protein [Ktedonobacterales bacterium]|nr:FAD binding domain-containing protein [Ktedonobacterales bacterium]